MRLLEGKTLSAEILASLAPRIAEVRERLGRAPSLAIVNYFADSPSAVYVKRKIAACGKLGITVKLFSPAASEGYPAFKTLLARLGADPAYDAIMLERPLPDGFETLETWDALPAAKDVDGLSSLNMGRLFIAKRFAELESGNFFVPCTALAVIRLLKHHGFDVAGKNIAVAGRSAVVGRPLAHMLTGLDATVTLCHTRTRDIAGVFKRSDIVILAAGKAKWVKKEMLGPGAVVIDVGTNFDESGKMCGDADEDIKDTAAAVTPVPGGVGPVTLACLLEAAVKAAELAPKPERGGIILT
ncbi:MAG: bifunctional 5,10-methylene-tetrahydrofolate dehydrogenase/5,10-methylene-tetrahydrofolate cyclohydrolase [Elusimicrobia bacterium CG08_land_8_20_14_0_20_59_10]|nr:MAG: bifunctional 5,10-methylene-tetrahydrofolate dehydrogenase/5,10-methylene-tetrahydrofolate cyclohydrolase [Elusimicrobia bacterium CG08_land_8_20_14_0_20_59_10]